MSDFHKHLSCPEANDRYPYPWVQEGGVFVKGYIYGEDEIITGKDLAHYFKNVDSSSSLSRLLENANGYFAVVIDTPTELYAAVDRVCSTHIFYRICESIEVGDSYKGFIAKSSRVNNSAVKSFLASGYVHGQDTLLEDVYQIPAGGVLTICKDNRAVKIRQYFSYLPTVDAEQKPRNELLKELHRIHLLVFERMVKSLNGKQVVVPLSGGYDSRLIIEMLAHFNHRNVLCVTWGAEEYWQVKIARDTAKSMGMEWLRVENNSEQWRHWYESGAFENGMEAAGAIATIPYVQDNVLVKKLKDDNRISSDAIFISGNSGDFVEGGHVSRIYSRDDVDELCRSIAAIHMRQNKLRNPGDVTKVIKRDILEFWDAHGDINGFDEYWEWRERQSKFVTKSVKVFEENGFEWRMPFWDLEIMDFWRSVPREMKLNRTLFYEYAGEYMSPRLPRANPAIPLIRRYSDALTDGRYGCFKPGSIAISGLISSSKRVSGVDLQDVMVHRPISFTRINGLVALDTFGRIFRAMKSI